MNDVDPVSPRVPAAIVERMIAARREIHRHPELSGRERNTAEFISRCLEDLRIPCRRDVAGGVVADLAGTAEGPLVAIRADMDALPIEESTGLPFASESAGAMHACGHDGHCAMVLGALELLLVEGGPRGPVRAIFQPAEEIATGASAMVEAGVLEGVDCVFGMHVDPRLPVGTVIVHTGTVNAAADMFVIEVIGRGAHAARPQEGVDAVLVGSRIVSALQSIVSRRMDPADPVVVTVGRFVAGTAPNVIAARAVLEGTIRSQTADLQTSLRQTVSRVARATAEAHDAQVTVSFHGEIPPVVNQPAMAELARRAARRTTAAGHIIPLDRPNMGGEDFARYLELVPGCYVRLGARPRGGGEYPAHSGHFDFDEAVLPVGARYLTEVVRESQTGRTTP